MALTPEQQQAIDAAITKYGGGMFGGGVTSNVVNAGEARDLDAERQKILDQILANAENQRGENTAYVDSTVAPELDTLKQAAAKAAMGDQAALGMQDTARDAVQGTYNKVAADTTKSANRFNNLSGDMWDQLSGQMSGLNASDQAAQAQYQRETDPLMNQLQAGGWGQDVTADAEGLGAQRQALGMALGDAQSGGADQRDVMSRYKELSSPEVSAQERLIGEMARRKFEGQDRGNREAVQQNLAQRGLNSGTLQIANNLAAQERLGQDRTLSEMGMQANAVGRGMQGLAGYGEAAGLLRGQNQSANALYGSQAGDLRTQGDALSQFNKTGSQISQRFQNQYAQDEANRVGSLAGQRNAVTQSTNQAAGNRATTVQQEGQDMLTGNFGREETARDAQTGAADVGYKTNTDYNNSYAGAGQREFNNQQGVVGAATGVAGARAGASDPGGTQEALKIALGENDIDQAENENDRVV